MLIPIVNFVVVTVVSSLLLCSTVNASKNVCNVPNGFDNLLSSIPQIQNKGKDDQYVRLKGRLTSFLGNDCYEFTDSMGNSIEVELDDDIDWSNVHKDQLIEICGKIDKDLFVLKIEAKSYQALESPKSQDNLEPFF